ncbi:MAG: sigma-70 family RNA polymerase sigma factor [Solirubrobacterales bacterium]
MAVHRNARRLVDLAAESEHLQAEELVERYGNQWLASARRSSPTAADAEDAYQRALETLLTNPPETRDPEMIAAWMHTVIRNEALQIVRSRKREVDTEFDVIVGGLAAETANPAESLLDSESHGVAKEALRRLRPDQTRCLLLRADGFDYPEICRLTGFSYAKVNRLLSEGRKAARLRVDAITGGRECERLEPLISMFVDGEADQAMERDVRLHLETCGHCRATVRDYTTSARDLAALFPVGAVFAEGRDGFFGDLFEKIQVTANSVYERVFGHAVTAQGSEVLTAKKITAAAAIAAALAGGGVVAHNAATDQPESTKPKSSAAGPGPAALVDQIPASELRAIERRRAAARKARAATAADLTSAQGDDAAETAAREATPAADQEVAADPNNAAPAGAPEDTGTDVGGLTP